MENKYQHYVPKFYLRNFSNDNKSIGSYVYAHRKLIANAPIRRICGRDHLYGEDLHIEKWFQDLEGIWSRIIGKIISSNEMDIDTEEWTYLLIFFYLSDVRTAYAADAFIEEANLLAKVEARLYREHRGVDISDEDIEKLQVTVDKPNLLYLQNLRHLPEMVGDLSMALLYNTSSRQFVTSDSPVVKYNQLFVARNYNRAYGYGQVGIQCFLPISPRHCLVLYDDVVYECKKKKNLVIKINAPDQIMELNKLFVENSRQALYFNNSEKDWIIERMVRKKADTSRKFNNGVFGDAKQGFLIMHSTESIHKKVKLPQFAIRPDFLKVPFPEHADGPLRPGAEARMDRMASKPSGTNVMRTGSFTQWVGSESPLFRKRP